MAAAEVSFVQRDEIQALHQTIIKENLADGKITGRWHSVNSFVVHAKDWSQGFNRFMDHSDEVSLKQLKWQTDRQHYIFRKLNNETHTIFMELQNFSKTEDSLNDSMRLNISHQYRSVLQACVVELQKKLKNENDAENEDMKEQLELLTIIEMFWHLCEIILVDTKPGGSCMSMLLDWVRWHFTKPDRLAEEILLFDEPSSHENYWPTVLGYVMQGRLRDAGRLLEHHPERTDGSYNAFRSIEELMESMPEFGDFPGQSIQDFSHKWHLWQRECKVRLESGEFNGHNYLETICEILCGSEGALEEQREICQSWYELLIARLLYSEPTVKTHELHSHALAAIESIGGYECLAPLDEIVLAILNFDVLKVIKKCSESLPNWWFVAHLTDLLFHCGMLKDHDLGYGADLREFLILEYSQSLMANQSMWQVASDYLVSCPKYGRAQLEVYVERIPLDSDKKAVKVLRLCEQHGLLDQAKSICKVMAMRAFRYGRLGSALSWCLRAKDAVFADFLAERIFIEYMDTGTLYDLDVIDSLGPAMLLSDKLTFLGKYREFHKLYKDGKFNEAGNLLLQLLSSSLAPQRFWMTLLIDALPLIEHDKTIFSSAQTYQIIHCLQELQLSINSEKYFARPDYADSVTQIEDEKDKLALLRLGLSRNLARALLHEKCEGK